MLFSETAHVMNNVMTARLLTSAQLPSAIIIDHITIRIITLVDSNQDGV